MPIGLLARSTIPITRTVLQRGRAPCFYFGTSARPLMPTPPPEMKWFYKEVWSALQPSLERVTPRNLSQTMSSARSHSNPESSQAAATWTERITNIREQGFKMVERYGLREKLDLAFQQYCRLVTAVKEFFYQKRYHQMGTLMTDGLKTLEDRVRSIREGRPLGRDSGSGPTDGKVDGVCVKAGEADAVKDEKKIIIKLTPKKEEKA
ncbi:hypothetical protein RP20_CCG007391 [Aedes albopictus]|nr:hypothetical protein RP20_CCG007391 [Aedes albopictus]